MQDETRTSQTVIFTIGLHGSGKTTWSKNFVKKHPNYKRVSRDDFRHMTTSYVYNDKNEVMVNELWKVTVKQLLDMGYNLVIDEKNTNKKLFEQNKEFVLSCNPDVKIGTQVFKITLEQSIQRDLERPFSIGEKIIRKHYYEHIAPKPVYDCYEEPSEEEKRLPAYIFDIDGTLALKCDRGDFSFEKAIDDTCNEKVAFMAEILARVGMDIIIVTGREAKYKEITENWLKKNNIRYTEFYCRETGDQRPDNVIKREIFHEYIEPTYTIYGVFDDRASVVRMWQRELGLFTFDVGQDVDKTKEK